MFTLGLSVTRSSRGIRQCRHLRTYCLREESDCHVTMMYWLLQFVRLLHLRYYGVCALENRSTGSQLDEGLKMDRCLPETVDNEYSGLVFCHDRYDPI